MYKICSKCKEEKLFGEFGKKKTTKDGLQYECKHCRKVWADNNKEYFKKYRQENIERISNRDSNRYLEHMGEIRDYKENYYILNRERLCAKQRTYQKLNKPKINALIAKRKANKIQATPLWLTNEQIVEIEELYQVAHAFRLLTGQEYHVDHIVPLQGKNVCGLHVPWNLQVIPASENLKKSNKLLED